MVRRVSEGVALAVVLGLTVFSGSSGRPVAAQARQQSSGSPDGSQPAPPSQQPATAPPSAQQPPAQQPPAQQPPSTPPDQPVFRAGINFVRVDVIVSDKNGNPVGNLKPEDFEVLEENKAQKIETFKLISLDGGLIPGPDGPPRQILTDLDEETEAAREDVRLFALFLDDYHVRLESSMSARGQLSRFIDTQMGPSDMIGVMYPLQPIASVRMTRNHDAVMRGLEQFKGRKYDYSPTNEFEEQYAYYPPEAVEKIRNQVSMTALKSLIIHLGGLKEGRKALILVSEGFTSLLPPQMRDSNAQFPGSGNPNYGNPQAGSSSPLEDRAQMAANWDMDSDLRDIWDLANKNNVAIYAVDPRGLTSSEFGVEQNIGIEADRNVLNSSMETLRTLAVNTDGRAIVNRNDLTLGMKQIIRDTSAYYLLGYNSSFTATDGKFHEIKVRVKRPGVQVRARKGYYAFTAADAARATAPPKPEPPKAVDAALAALARPSKAQVVRTWMGTDRGANGKTQVTFVWEPLPHAPGDRVRESDIPARVSLTAVAPDGSPLFRGRIPDGDLAPSASPSAPAKVSFEVPPGPVQLRVVVETKDADTLDSEVREVNIPDLSKPQTLLSTPTVFRGRTIPELQRLKTDPRAVPTPARDFTRTDRVFMRVHVYGPGATPPALTAKLLNRTGQAMSDLPVTVSAGDARDIDLTLTSLPAGEYVVEITAAADGEPVKTLVGFRMAG
jgi:VWFA-related protein